MSRRRPNPSRRLPRSTRARIHEDAAAPADRSTDDAEWSIRIRRDAGGLAEVEMGPRLTRARVFLIEEWFRRRAADVLHLVLDLEGVDHLEVGALEALEAMVRRISRAGCHVGLAGTPDHLREIMDPDEAGLVPMVTPARCCLGGGTPADEDRVRPTG